MSDEFVSVRDVTIQEMQEKLRELLAQRNKMQETIASLRAEVANQRNGISIGYSHLCPDKTILTIHGVQHLLDDDDVRRIRRLFRKRDE